ncbi:hypothetical protein FB567DRAFT_455484 [Paraphoma chrysanthemicola]|uniref:Uncharacterized protein n=1 Tax=Paraphoma chrysanthemicola TaxID=798071 RepID=A0A8K0VT83_9PLEO|nr:hypothetical protein FB567DRAFT_455484 [Paraphoma chrysanthemicola]
MAHRVPGTNFTVPANYTLGEVVKHCHKPDCSWLYLPHLVALEHPPPLLPNPELSGIGVILGFSITAYLTLLLLLLHYFTVHNVRRTNVANAVDEGVLTFVRNRLISWKPSRRFEYAMEKSVLILSDTQLVTGLGILIAGYSQLQCGISAYHWQIMVFVAWFASFSFLSAMTFLEGYFQTNNNMRLIRVGFMVILSSLLIVALLPTGSKNWLNMFHQGEGYYPSLSTACFYKQLLLKSFVSNSGPKIWSMVFSIFVVIVSYLQCGIRLFDPGAQTSHKYLRVWPGWKIKKALYHLERKTLHNGTRARLWLVPYLASYAIFVCCRAFYDIVGSMLLEVIWLSFAIAWGTIKVWTTRAAAQFTFDGAEITINQDVSEENTWSFGQTLPLVLILLPILSMAQAYLDNDAKAQNALEETERVEQRTVRETNDHGTTVATKAQPTSATDDLPDPRRSTSWPALPQYPYSNFTSYPWYNDQIFLLLCQTLMVTAFSLWVLTELANIMGISAILRNRLFLIWVLGLVPLNSLVHLSFWYGAASIVVRWPGCEDWLKGEGEYKKVVIGEEKWWKPWTAGQVVYWGLRFGLVAGCLMFTFFGSLDAASPYPLDDSI